jgi:hypothetical protein
MNKSNLEKKKEIDAIITVYKAKIVEIKEKRDIVVSGFLEVLRERKIKELRKTIKQ